MPDFQAKIANGAVFARLLELALPGASARTVQKALGPKADLREIANWKSGKRWPADWAVAIARDLACRRIAELETWKAQLQSGPGRKGNRANLKPFRQTA